MAEGTGVAKAMGGVSGSAVSDRPRPRHRERVETVLRSGEPLTEADTTQLHGHYFRPLVGYATKQGAADPEGVANLALFDGFRAQGRRAITDEPAFRSYLYRAAKSHVLNESRRQTPIFTELTDGEFSDDELAGGALTAGGAPIRDAITPADEIVEREWMAGVFSQLPLSHQEVLNLRVVEGLSAEEAGARLDRAPNAVYQLQHRAQQRLRALVLMALVAIAIAAGAALLWALSSSSSRVENHDPIDERPVENSSTSQPPTPVVADVPVPSTAVSATTAAPTAGAPFTAVEVETIQTTPATQVAQAGQTTPEAPVVTLTATTAAPATALTPTTRTSTTRASSATSTRVTPTTSASTTLTSTTVASTSLTSTSVTSTTVTSTTLAAPTTVTSAQTGAAPFNICQTTTEANGGVFLKLYDPAVDPAGGFTPPVALRLAVVDPDTQALSTVWRITRADILDSGWIDGSGVITFRKPAGAATWGALLGPAGTEIATVEYEISEQLYVYEGCPQ